MYYQEVGVITWEKFFVSFIILFFFSFLVSSIGIFILGKHFYPKDKHAVAAFLSGIKIPTAFSAKVHFHFFTTCVNVTDRYIRANKNFYWLFDDTLFGYVRETLVFVLLIRLIIILHQGENSLDTLAHIQPSIV